MRRKKRFEKKQRSRFIGIFLRFIFPIILIAAVGIFFAINTKYWNGNSKISVVEQSGVGDVSVKVYDPVLDEVTTLTIPGDTQVSVSRNLGTLRIKNVWQLGVNEKVGGILLAETVRKNFLFPVFLWRGPQAQTNVPFGDRLLVWYFEKKTKNLQKTEINLGESQYVKRQKLSDGELGYKIVGDISERLTVYFTDPDFSKASPGIYVKDLTGKYGVAEVVGGVIEVMGGKVTTIEKGQADDSDCLVSGVLARKVARIFDCKVAPGKIGNDIEIILGTSFAERF